MRLRDVTLREGEQRLGRSYSVEQKVAVGEKLDALGVDAIQIGFPVARDGTKAVIERLDTDAKLLGAARAVERDIDALHEAGADELQVAVPTSDILRESVLGLEKEEVVELVIERYEYARDYGLDVTVHGVDSFRSDPDFLSQLIDATDTPRFTLYDTVGKATPRDVSSLLEELDCNPDRLGVHFHRDLGVGVANVLTAADYGVSEADVTVGGIGERAGNAALEQVVVAGTVGPSSIEFDIDLERLVPTCHEILDVLDEDVPPHQPVLGKSAFEHESGLHTAKMLDEPSTYEPYDPALYGGERRLLFGPSSGHSAARRIIELAGYDDPSDATVEAYLETLHGLDEHVELEEALALTE